MFWITREQLLAGSHSTPWHQLDALARSRDAATRLRVARNPSARTEALWVLARDADAEVREEVARRTDAPGRLLAVLSEDPSTSVRSAVARNTTAGVELLRVLAEDPHHGVRFAVQANQLQRLRTSGERAGAVGPARTPGAAGGRPLPATA